MSCCDERVWGVARESDKVNQRTNVQEGARKRERERARERKGERERERERSFKANFRHEIPSPFPFALYFLISFRHEPPFQQIFFANDIPSQQSFTKMEILAKKATPTKKKILSMRERRAQANFTQKTSSICVPWLIHTCAMTHSYVCHESFICVPWLIHMCAMTHSCVPWLIHMCAMTHSYVCHDFTQKTQGYDYFGWIDGTHVLSIIDHRISSLL